ncbi:MAG: 2-succinyl-5-enolpyruvyl-6-hydroxy-3-cyclohexene-1-carboxylic-acid synthase, partial [Actinomycetota bacterium]
FVVVNNDGGGIFSFLPQAEHPANFEKLFGTPQELDFRALAASAGCGYGAIGDASALVPAVRSALDAGGVHLLEARTDRAANVALHWRLWQAVSDSLEAGGPQG